MGNGIIQGARSRDKPLCHPSPLIVQSQRHGDHSRALPLDDHKEETRKQRIAVYNDTSAGTAGNRIVPSVTYDASALGINGFILQFGKKFTTGLYVAISNIGSGEVIVDYRAANDLVPHKFV